jgi:S-adenosylmethionine hydrolase
MKGVILGIASRVRLVDISHQVTPFETREAAFLIAESYRYFPKGTIHVVVVDPGVGSARRPILVEAARHYFLGPDNGVLHLVYGREKARVRHITNAKYFLKSVSQTFHGRDIFAPVAAHLAMGVRPAAIGPTIDDFLKTDTLRPIRSGKRCWAGAILKADRFGNLVTSFHIDEFPAVRERPFVLLAGLHTIDKLVGHYAEAPPGEPVAVIGSSGYIEVCVNQASAARQLGCGSGAPAELSIY